MKLNHGKLVATANNRTKVFTSYPFISNELEVRKIKNMKNSDDDKVEGNTRKVTGTIKEAAGKVTDNPKLEAKGKLEKANGAVQSKIGDIKKVFNK